MKNDTLHKTNYLLKLATRNRSKQIKAVLNTLNGTTKYKGDVFEHFIAELYHKTGWNTQVTGGKNDKGVDILLYHPQNPSNVEAIVQTKNLKTALSSKNLSHEYSNFFGNNFSNSQGSSDQHNCKKLIIISLNGYTKDAKNFQHPYKDTHQVDHLDWADVEILIEKYSSNQKHINVLVDGVTIKRRIKTITNTAREYVAIIVIILIVLVFCLTERNSVYEYDVLTDAMIARLHETKLTKSRQTDCEIHKYPLATCPEQLVDGYTDKYGNGKLKIGLIIYFCGQGNFKKDKCRRNSKRRAWYVLNGKK